MWEFWAAFGRGVVKLLVSLFAGVGVGFLTFGIIARDRPELWRSREPPNELFIGIGAGLLTTAVLLLLLFGVPWLLRRAPPGRWSAGPGGGQEAVGEPGAPGDDDAGRFRAGP
jgi:hypothetical protein